MQSQSYLLEIEKFYPQLNVVQEACPMWVPLIENGEHLNEGADYFIQKHIDNVLKSSPNVDTLLLACTHYPLLKERIQHFLPAGIQIVSQAEIVANSLKDYLQRHTEIETKLSKNSVRKFYTTDAANQFDEKATLFFGSPVQSAHVDL